MQSRSTDQLSSWVKALPHSEMIWPDSYIDRFKYVIWRLYTPYHSFFRDTATSLGIVRHEGRQNYLLGRIAPGQTVQEFVEYLISKGYANHFVAWKDDGEVVSLRFVRDFKYQYHVRVFQDGEVRGHYEYTPECHLVWHMQEVDMEQRRDEFLKLMGSRLVVHKPSRTI